MRKTYVFIDFENVQPATLSALGYENLYVVIFVGANQTKIGIDVASTLQSMGERATYIKISGNGANALDFHIAFYLGKFSSIDPSACFYILSKDTGFDPLIDHLRQKEMRVVRVKTIEEISSKPKAGTLSLNDKTDAVRKKLIQMKNSKPRLVKTLQSTVNALFQKTLDEREINAIIESLIRTRVISINQTKVMYL